MELNVIVVDLDKKVKVRLVGMGEEGYNKLLDYGHEDYIFPIHLHDRPYKIDPGCSSKVKEDAHERWLRLIAAYKGEVHVSKRKEYVLVDSEGNIIKKRLCNEEEFLDKLEFEEGWKQRHPGEKPITWRLANV